MDAGDYARASALVAQATLIRSIEVSFPTLTQAQQDEILLDILHRIALRLGWTMRRNGVEMEDDG